MGIYYSINHGYRKHGSLRFGIILGTLIVSGLAGYFYLTKSKSPAIVATSTQAVEVRAEREPKLKIPLSWPNYGQAAYGALDDGLLAASDDKAKPVPVASLAKIITALAILKQKPLNAGDQGPLITLTEQDEALYREYIIKNGTVIPVHAGVQISEYQALQAMLLSSANNMSDTLAIWAFGSIENYNTYANAMIRELGLSDTIIADASGYSPDTKSTAADMVQLGILYMKIPVLRDIASQKEATIPFAGQIFNFNATVNGNGITGLKIGYTEEAGRNFLVADSFDPSMGEVSVVAVIGADSMPKAMKDAKSLLKSGNAGHKLLDRKSSQKIKP